VELYTQSPLWYSAKQIDTTIQIIIINTEFVVDRLEPHERMVMNTIRKSVKPKIGINQDFNFIRPPYHAFKTAEFGCDCKPDLRVGKVDSAACLEMYLDMFTIGLGDDIDY